MNKLAGLICAAMLAVGCSQTDSGITTKVKSQFAADDVVKAYMIDVDTRDHVVTLRGEVDSPAAHERAMQIASRTEGVRDVVDQLVVNESAATSGDRDVDNDIDVGADLRRGGELVKEGAKETGAAVKEGAIRVKEGAERVGEKVADSVTDDDRDSDRDGK